MMPIEFQYTQAALHAWRDAELLIWRKVSELAKQL